MQEENIYRVVETGKGTTTFGAGELSGLLSEEQKDGHLKSLMEQGLFGFAFNVDKDGRTLSGK